MYRLLELTFLAGLIFAAVYLTVEPGIAAGQAGAGGGYVISMLRPGDPGFDASLDSNFAGIRNVSGFQQVEPLMAILQNESTHGAMAYVVEWKIENPDGSSEAASLSVIQEPGEQGSLTGQEVVLKPGETQLVSPLFHWSAREFPGLLRINAVMIVFQVFLTKPLISEVQASIGIQTSLDGTVFDDGMFTGPDTSELHERFSSEQTAQRDEARLVLKALNSGITTQQLQDLLSKRIKKGTVSTGMDIPSLYAAARGREAQRLLAIFERSGNNGMRRAAAQTSRSKVLSLQKAP